MRGGIFVSVFVATLSLVPAAPFAAGTVSVDIKLFQFKPKELDVKQGDTVIWTNGDAIEHSVTSKSFDSGFFTQGGSFRHTFDKAGSFTYFCKRHPNMRATVKVSP